MFQEEGLLLSGVGPLRSHAVSYGDNHSDYAGNGEQVIEDVLHSSSTGVSEVKFGTNASTLSSET